MYISLRAVPICCRVIFLNLYLSAIEPTTTVWAGNAGYSIGSILYSRQ